MSDAAATNVDPRLPSNAITVLCAWAALMPTVRAVWLFGSRIVGTPRPDSDLDVALEFVGAGEDWRAADSEFTAQRSRWEKYLAQQIGAGIPVSLWRLPSSSADLERNIRAADRRIYSKP